MSLKDKASQACEKIMLDACLNPHSDKNKAIRLLIICGYMKGYIDKQKEELSDLAGIKAGLEFAIETN